MLERFKNDQFKLRKSRTGQRGASSWDLRVVQLICELLVIGVPPSKIPATLQTTYETFREGDDRQDGISVSFVRQCRTVVQVIGETMAAIKYGEAEVIDQAFMDATTRRHSAMQTFIVGTRTEDLSLETVILSSCIFLNDETAENTVDAMFNKVCVFSELSCYDGATHNSRDIYLIVSYVTTLQLTQLSQGSRKVVSDFCEA